MTISRTISPRMIKADMLKFARSFSIERNPFQRFVIIHKYVLYIHNEPLAKSALQKVFEDTAPFSHQMYTSEEINEALASREFWTYYSNLEVIHAKMEKLKACPINKKEEFQNLQNLFSKPYSNYMLELSFKVVNSEIFDRLDQETFFSGERFKEEKTYFDEKKSILHVRGKKIRINKQNRVTNSHKILRHIFMTNANNLEDDFFFSEIALDEFDELDYTFRKDNWRKYHTACEIINKKVKKQAGFDDFLIFNTGTSGHVCVNKKYL